MKFRGSHVLFALLAVAVVIWAATQLGGGDDARIKKQLGELETLIEKKPGESQLEGAAAMRRLGDLLTPEFVIEIVPYSQSVTNRQELLRLAMGYRARSETIGVDFSVDELDVVAATARMAAVVTLTGEGLDRESYRLALEWQKSGEDWLIRRLDVLEVLEGTPFL